MSIDMVQKFVVEVDSVKLLKQYLRLAMATVLTSHEEVTVVDRSEKHHGLYLPSVLMDETKHFPVILIDGWYLPKEGEKNSYFGGREPWTTFRSAVATSSIDCAIEHIHELLEKQGETWRAQFEKRFGDGHHSGFNHFDGDVGLGYELRECGCFPKRLAISIVHMYYGK